MQPPFQRAERGGDTTAGGPRKIDEYNKTLTQEQRKEHARKAGQSGILFQEPGEFPDGFVEDFEDFDELSLDDNENGIAISDDASY